jgi:hypothetical protein
MRREKADDPHDRPRPARHHARRPPWNPRPVPRNPPASPISGDPPSPMGVWGPRMRAEGRAPVQSLQCAGRQRSTPGTRGKKRRSEDRPKIWWFEITRQDLILPGTGFAGLGVSALSGGTLQGPLPRVDWTERRHRRDRTEPALHDDCGERPRWGGKGSFAPVPATGCRAPIPDFPALASERGGQRNACWRQGR